MTPYALAREEVWSWRYEGEMRKTMFFNVHFDQASRLVKRITRTRTGRRRDRRVRRITPALDLCVGVLEPAEDVVLAEDFEIARALSSDSGWA